jgi:hypothetical protein
MEDPQQQRQGGRQTAAAALTFNGDNAHFDKAGATEMAQLAAQELLRINSPLAAYLK